MIRPLTASIAVAAIATVLSACAASPTARVTLDDVVAERAATIEAAERDRFDAFIAESGDRLDELGLPQPDFQGLVAGSEWDGAVTACMQGLDSQLDVRRLEGGFAVNYFGVVGDSFERIRWTIESCNAQYGIADPGTAPAAGDRELTWRYQDATRRLLPCLRSIGELVPSPPSVADFAEQVGTDREWSPYAFATHDPVSLVRAVALCPPSSTVLEVHLATIDTDRIGPS